jgi:hypothetical protein
MTLEYILPHAERSPFIAEQIAIDATDGLKAAAIGLRGFRSRPLLHRLWDGITGQGQELQAAIGSDLVVVQEATMNLVREVMSEGIRTQYCVERVLLNLHDVNSDLDGLLARVASLEKLVHGLKTRQHLIETKLRLETLFRAGELHPGTGSIFSSALYLAHITRLFGSVPDLAEEERRVALILIRQRVGERPEALPVLCAKTIQQIQPEAAEVITYLVSDRSGPTLSFFSMLAERLMTGVKVNIEIIEDSLTITRKLRDPEGRLSKHLFRPLEIIEAIASELHVEETVL